MIQVKIVTLITDFGDLDTYVAQMKAVIYSLATNCTIVDVTHQIPAQNVFAGAQALWETAFLFPQGTVHVVVVDPGVGTQRRLIAAKSQGHLFVMPDNGLISLVAEDFPLESVIELTEKKFWRDSVSNTFHGRDIMAPVAAHLSNGQSLVEMGRAISSITKLEVPSWTLSEDHVVGTITRIDHYGNAITNLPEKLFRDVETGRSIRTLINGREHCWRWSASYAFASRDAAIALIGSHGYLELAVNCGSAATDFGLKAAENVTVYF